MARPRQMADEEILAHAREVFLEHGSSASTNLVARACGLSQASLFKRFGDKRTLLIRALLPPDAPPFIELLKQGPSAEPLRPQLILIATEILSFFTEVVPCMTTLMSSGLNPHELITKQYAVPPPVVTLLAMTAWFAAASDRLRDVPADHLATQFLGALHVRAFMQHLSKQNQLLGDPGPYVESMVDVFLAGAQR